MKEIKKENIHAVVLGIFIAVLPFLAMPHTFALLPSLVRLVPNLDGYYTDLTVYGKGIFLLAFAVFAAVAAAVEFVKRRATFEKRHIPLAAFVLLAIISCAVSAQKDVVLFGIPTECFGLLHVVSLAVLSVYAQTFVKTDRQKDIVLMSLAVSGGLIGLLTMFEFFCKPLMETFFGVLAEHGYSLLFGNTGTAGAYEVLLFTLMLFTAIKAERRRWLYAAVCGLLAAAVILSDSSAAFYCMAAVSVAAVVCAVVKSRSSVVIFAWVLLPFAVIAAVGSERFLYHAGTSATNYSATSGKKQMFRLTNVDMQPHKLTFMSDDDSFAAEISDGYLSYGDVPNVVVKNNADGQYLMFDFGYADTVEFYYGDGFFQYIGLGGYLHDSLQTEKFPQFAKYYGKFTGRVYIWLNTLPILKETLVLGKGAGNFAFYFPQEDLVGALNTNGTTANLIDKPHNMFLQVWCDYGLPAMICFAGLLALAVRRAVVRKSYGVAAFVCVFAMLGMMNDLTIVTAALFCAFCSIGLKVKKTA